MNLIIKKKQDLANSFWNILSNLFAFFCILTISSSSFLPDVSHGEHDRKAGELWRPKTGCTTQFTATLGSSALQLPLTSTFALRRHSPQGKGALCLQVSACGAACFGMLTMFCLILLNQPHAPFSLSFCPPTSLQVLWENLPPFGKPHQTLADTHRGAALQVFFSY